MTSKVRRWLALVVVALVFITAGVAIVRRVASTVVDEPTVTDAPAATSSPTPQPRETPPSEGLRLTGAGDAVAVIQTNARVYQLTLQTGTMRTTPIPELTRFSSVVAGNSWVLIKTVDDTTGVLIDTNGRAQPLPSGLQTSGRVFLTGQDDMWLVPEEPSGGVRIASRFSTDGRRVGTATIRLSDKLGIPRSDMAGNLLIITATGAYQAAPTGIRQINTGQLIGLNAGQALSLDPPIGMVS